MTESLDTQQARAYLHLANLQLTPRLLRALLERFGNNPQQALEASDSEREGITGWLSRHTERVHDAAYRVSEKQWEWFQSHPVRILSMSEPDYPLCLSEIHDPPPFVFIYGTFTQQDHLAFGIVGSRRASPYGRGVAEQMARDLAGRGVTILSGGAAGIDTAAHRGALATGGRTVAVLGCGIDVVYPHENRNLFQQIIENGALLSEYPIGAQPEFWRFPARNRIISGMSQGILIVEAPRQSGALITARYAAEHGRPLGVIPGNIDRPMSVGSNELLREGATPILESADLLHLLRLLPVSAKSGHQTALSFESETAPSKPERAADAALFADLSETAQRILKVLSNVPKHIDDIARECMIESAPMGVEMTLLELSGLVSRLPGNIWVRI